MVSYYRQYISDFAAIAKPFKLKRLTAKGQSLRRDEEDKAEFDTLNLPPKGLHPAIPEPYVRAHGRHGYQCQWDSAVLFLFREGMWYHVLAKTLYPPAYCVMRR